MFVEFFEVFGNRAINDNFLMRCGGMHKARSALVVFDDHPDMGAIAAVTFARNANDITILEFLFNTGNLVFGNHVDRHSGDPCLMHGHAASEVGVVFKVAIAFP